MLDNRIFTFLKLCELLNYRKTAEALNMTQPAVTQHIQYLESFYGVSLFSYKNKQLSITKEGEKLEQYARSVVANESFFQKEMKRPKKQQLFFGASKTIGDYIINTLVMDLLQDDSIQLKVIIDNTKCLLSQLNNFELDFLLIEGYFDKNLYDSHLIKKEELVGICSKTHRFANKTISISQLFTEHLIIREKGSGTRSIFESFLNEHNYSLSSFHRYSELSSLPLILSAVEKNLGISFAYQSLLKGNEKVTHFYIEDTKIFHELNFVTLKNSRKLESYPISLFHDFF